MITHCDEFAFFTRRSIIHMKIVYVIYIVHFILFDGVKKKCIKMYSDVSPV